MSVAEIVRVVFGLVLICAGIRDLMRGRTWASREGESEREYKGASAIVLALIWILLGMLLLGVFGNQWQLILC